MPLPLAMALPPPVPLLLTRPSVAGRAVAGRLCGTEAFEIAGGWLGRPLAPEMTGDI